MVNSVTPIPTPPIARAKMAIPRLVDLAGAAVDGEITLLICLLLVKGGSGTGTDATAVGRDGPDSLANPWQAGAIPGAPAGRA